jgi:branched-chain amino acid transport system permease protein
MLPKNERGDPAPRPQENRVRLRLVALLPLLVLIPALVAAPAMAQETPSPEPTPTSAGETPSEPPDGPYIGVTLIDDSAVKGGGEGKPVPDVTITVATSDGEEVGSGVTGADGRALIPLPERGSYTVTLDTTTLPPGVKLSGDAATKKTVNALLDGGNFAQFQIGVADVEKVSFGTKLTASVVSGLKFGLIVALAALGLNLIFGTTGLTNFAHGELITFGGIATYVVNHALGAPVIVAGIAAIIISGAFGWIQDRGMWRPLRQRGTGLIAMMIVSIGFALLMRNVFQYGFGGSTQSLSEYVNQPRDDYGIVKLADKEIAIFVISILTIVVVCIALMKTRLGKAMRAVSDNPALSASSGLRVDGVISAVWVLGTALTGLAGVLTAINTQVNFQMGYKLLLLVFAAVTLGGLGTIWGALLGSMVIGILVEVSPLFGVPSSIKEIGALFVLIVILLVKPQGILGRRERVG